MIKKVIRKKPEAILNNTASFSTSNKLVVSHIGAIMNSEIAKTIANNDERRSANLFFGLFDSVGIAISADHWRVSIPIFIDSYNPAIPLRTGFLQNAERSPIEEYFFLSTCILPFGSRTAVA